MTIKPDYFVSIPAHAFASLIGLGTGTIYRLTREGAIEARMVGTTKYVVLRTVRSQQRD
jgi:hypothetical protein